MLHSDGNLNSIMPYLIEAGFDGLHPVELSSGMYLEELKHKYENKIVFFGNFKLALLKYDIDTLQRIFEKRLDILTKSGGYVFGFESPITQGVDLDKYRTVLEMVKHYGSPANKNFIR